MRFRAELAAFALLAGALTAPPANAADPAPAAPTAAEMDAAFAKVKADPNLAAERTVRTLKYEPDDERREKFSIPDWLRWIGNLFGWIAQVSRVLVWLIIAALIAAVVLVVVRILQKGRGLASTKGFVAPTHVQDLDIRPESLPDDIGATARTLWDTGDRRAALALLYRGMLSRLAHVHEIPIRASSTEGDCLALAVSRLDAVRIDYVTRLIRSWQRAIYGGVTLESADVHDLCAQFARHFDPPPPPGRAQGLAEAAT